MLQTLIVAERKTITTPNKDFLPIILGCILLGVLLFISIFVKEFIYVTLTLAIIMILLKNNVRGLYFIIFLIPLMNIFKNDRNSTHLIALLIVEFDIALFVKFIIEVCTKKRKINIIFSVLTVVTILYFVFPFTIARISVGLSFIAGFILLYFVITYNKDVDFKEVTYIYFLGMLFSIVIGLFIKISPRLLYLCPIFKGGGLDRFGACYANVNVFDGEILIAISLFMILYLKKEMGYSFFLIYSFLLAMCLLTISKFSLIIFTFILILFLIFLNFDKISVKQKLIDNLLVIVFTVIVLLLFKKYFMAIAGRLLEFKDLGGEIAGGVLGNSAVSGGVQTGIDIDAGLSTFTTGRWDIWKSYISVIIKNSKNIFLGVGADAPYVNNEAPHNTIILLVYYFGLVGTLLYISCYLCLIRKKFFKKIDLRCSLSIIAVFSFINYLGFYSCMFSLYLLLGFLNIVQDKETEQIVSLRGVKIMDINKDKCILAILTPTYNRAELLKRAYDSLKNQTNKNFVWYVVDDGSSDNTEGVVKGFIEENTKNKDFKIVYIKKENGGKHTALNVGIKQIEEPFTIILDSDDHLVGNAVDTIYCDANRISEVEDICGVGYLRKDEKGKVIGRPYIQDQMIDTFINQRFNKNTYGDKAEVFKTNILKDYPFPEFEGEKFVSEATVWCAMSGKYKMLFINKSIYVCEYQEGGLSDGVHKRLFKNPKGAATCYKMLSTKEFCFALRVRYTIAYIVYSIEAGISFKQIKQNHSKNKFLITMLYLPSKVYHKKLLRKYSK